MPRSRVRLKIRAIVPCSGCMDAAATRLTKLEGLAMDREQLMERMANEASTTAQRLGASASGSLLDLAEVERAIYAECDRLKASLLQQWVEQASDDSGRPACPRCGGVMKHKGREPRSSACVGGQVTVKRTRWWCDACGAAFSPGG